MASRSASCCAEDRLGAQTGATLNSFSNARCPPPRQRDDRLQLQRGHRRSPRGGIATAHRPRSEAREIATIAELLVTDALTYAPAYYEPVKTLPDVVALLSGRVSQQSIPGQSLAIAYCLLGEKDKAMAALSENIDRVRTRPDDAARRARLLKFQEIFGLPIGL